MSKLPNGVVNIRGKEYTTVALRVHHFREARPGWTLTTEIVHRDQDCVVMRAVIGDEQDRVLATGHAEEYRTASDINRTSALENCETSAIGRALAALGFGGTEFASADEVAHAVSGNKGSAIQAFEDKHLPHLEEAAQMGLQALQAAFAEVPGGTLKSQLWTAHQSRLKAIAKNHAEAA